MSNDAISLRLVEWNVAMSLGAKTHLLAELNPTVAVLPESAHPDRTRAALDAIGASAVEWVGANPNKGLTVVAFDGWSLRVDESFDPGYEWVLPLHLTGPRHVRLLAVWDMGNRGKGHASARQLGACRASLPHYDEFLSGDADLAVISGDFNNSVYWDKPSKRAKFGDFMDDLEARGYVSAYHHHHRCARGAEPHPTLWWKRNPESTYHIDYTFVSRAAAVDSVAVGAHADWLAHSDHAPMTVDLRVERLLEPPADTVDQTRMTGTHTMRFEIDPALPDMICGRNGDYLTQAFRPTYFTADWRNGYLIQVRIWGQRVLDDGSLGQRYLDHRWKQTPARGPVRYADLPAPVASRLRVYNDGNGFDGLP